MSYHRIVRTWAVELREVVEQIGGSVSIRESALDSECIDVDFPDLVAQVCVWPNGAIETTVAHVESDDVDISHENYEDDDALERRLVAFRTRVLKSVSPLSH